MPFQLFVDSSTDMPLELREKFKIDYYRMGINVDGKEYHADINWEEYSYEQLYDWVRDPKVKIKTSLIPVTEFIERSEPYLKKGIDILYLGCTSALSGSRGVFELTKEELKAKYPDRKIVSVETCRCEMDLGMMAMEVAKLRDEGKSIEECVKWVEENKEFYHQVGSLETLKYLKAQGRVSGAAAFFGDMISLKPVIMFDTIGRNYAYTKVQGGMKALKESLRYIKENMIEGVTDVVYVGHAQAPERFNWLKEHIENELHIPVIEYRIGAIVGISCGPGMYGCYFRGKEVTEKGEDK